MSKILVVEDEKKMRHILKIILEGDGFEVDTAEHGHEALQRLERGEIGLVVTDIKMPVMDGMELLKAIKANDADLPVVMITAFGSVSSAVSAMQAGALDYITKPFDEERVLMAVRRGMAFSRLAEERRIWKDELAKGADFSNIIARSENMLEILKQAALVSRSPDTTALILGESGVGKELIAKAIHFNSPRANRPLLAINCAAISPNLVESELFGHEKGAFTGADKTKPGKFELAQGGTIFLDEIGDLDASAQAKVLRVLQEKEFERVGGSKVRRADVRVVCATNRNLTDMVAAGQFREDLFYRINVFPINIPPLRERTADIVPLAEYFVKKFTQDKARPKGYLTDESRRILTNHTWPGNVRELENAIERAAILSSDGRIDEKVLSFIQNRPKPDRPAMTEETMTIPPEGLDIEAIERRLIEQALRMSMYNQSRAAELLGLSRGKFRIKLKNLK
ncbi:MAG: sigma-54-dependent Fis family transcriptional regulator [Deltaproteobacteria bacterium]|nr:sigma-54-dependent Fis family transcriptional regulator [Deltaproteobacteria bacterium]